MGVINLKEPTLFKVKLLVATVANDSGDILEIKEIDEDRNVYYYDSYDRWSILKHDDENIVWEKIMYTRKMYNALRMILSWIIFPAFMYMDKEVEKCRNQNLGLHGRRLVFLTAIALIPPVLSVQALYFFTIYEIIKIYIIN